MGTTRKKTARERWEEAYEANAERDAEFSTMSGTPIKPLYTPEGVEGNYDVNTLIVGQAITGHRSFSHRPLRSLERNSSDCRAEEGFG